jgi:hypothetical protein
MIVTATIGRMIRWRRSDEYSMVDHKRSIYMGFAGRLHHHFAQVFAMNIRASQDRYSMENLAEIVTNPDATNEEKRLALSVAYETGRVDALRAAKQQPEKLPW